MSGAAGKEIGLVGQADAVEIPGRDSGPRRDSAKSFEIGFYDFDDVFGGFRCGF